MKYVFLTIFSLSAAIHLYASHKNNKKIRNITKPFLLLALLGFYLLATEKVQILIVLALIFSWLGDVLLIPHGVKWFTAGGIAFMISHFFFILGYRTDVVFARVPVWLIVLLGAIFVCLVSVIFSRLRKHLPKALFYPMFLYLLINGTMNCFALFRLCSLQNLAGAVTGIGAALFFVSDSCLFFVRFNKESRMKSHFWVMLTYCLGEFLIVLGLV
ncbi:MAG: lysoplasmalogenase [Firmicutes bacterium]|nr:lysoplasmalogenase [Bacillota bacterium]